MPEWLTWTNATVAIPLQVVGFGIAFWQIARTKRSADAAKNAAESATGQIGVNMLLMLLPQLNQVEVNIEWAVGRSDREATLHYLGSWRWQAGQARGLLLRAGVTDENMLQEIQASISSAADSKLALQDVTADVPKRCRAVQKSIAKVTGSLGELAATHSLEGTNPDGI